MDLSHALTLIYDGDLYEAKRTSTGKWEIIRYPDSPLFKPTRVELTRLPQRLYDEFTAHFLRVAHEYPNESSKPIPDNSSDI